MEGRMSSRTSWENDNSFSQGRNPHNSNNYSFQDTSSQAQLSEYASRNHNKEQVQSGQALIDKEIRVVHVPGRQLPNNRIDFQSHNSHNHRSEFDISNRNLNNNNNYNHNYNTVSTHNSNDNSFNSYSGNTPQHSNAYQTQLNEHQLIYQQPQQLQQQQQQHPFSSSQHQPSFQSQQSHPYLAPLQPTHNSSSLPIKQAQYPIAAFQQPQSAAQQFAMLQRNQENSQQYQQSSYSSQQQYYSQPLSNPIMQPSQTQQQQEYLSGYDYQTKETQNYQQISQAKPQQQFLQTPSKAAAIYPSQPATTSITLNNPSNIPQFPQISHSLFGRKANPMRCSSSCKPNTAQHAQQQQQQPQQQKLQSSPSSHSIQTQQPFTENLTNNKENLKLDMYFNSPRPKQLFQENEIQQQGQDQQQMQLQHLEAQRINEQINVKTRARQDSEQSQSKSQLNFDDRELLARYEKHSPQSRFLYPQNNQTSGESQNHNPYASYYFQPQGNQYYQNEQQTQQQINQQDYHQQQQQLLQYQQMIAKRYNIDNRQTSQNNITSNSTFEQFQHGSDYPLRNNHSLAPQISQQFQHSMNTFQSQPPSSTYQESSSQYSSPQSTNYIPQQGMNQVLPTYQQPQFQSEQTKPLGNSNNYISDNDNNITEGIHNVRVVRYSSRDLNTTNQNKQQLDQQIFGETVINNQNNSVNDQNNNDRFSSSPSASSTSYSTSTTKVNGSAFNSDANNQIHRKQILTSFKRASAAVVSESSLNTPTNVSVITNNSVNIRVNSNNNDEYISDKENKFNNKQNLFDEQQHNQYNLSAQQQYQQQQQQSITVEDNKERITAELNPTGLQNIQAKDSIFPIIIQSTQGLFDDCIQMVIQPIVEQHEMQQNIEQLPELTQRECPPSPLFQESEEFQAPPLDTTMGEITEIPSNFQASEEQQANIIQETNLIEDINTPFNTDTNQLQLQNINDNINNANPPKVSLSNFITQVNQNASQISCLGNIQQVTSNVNITNCQKTLSNEVNQQDNTQLINDDDSQEVEQSTQQVDNQIESEESKDNKEHLLQAMNHVIQLPERQSTNESNESAKQCDQSSLEQENNHNSNDNDNNQNEEPTMQQEDNKVQDNTKNISDSASNPLPEHLYYASSLAHAFQNPSDLAVVSTLARDHLLQTMQSVILSRTITPPTMEQIESKRVFLPPVKENITKTLIFDLDETLVHCNENPDVPSDITIDITFPTGEKVKAGINIRPYAIECLKELSELYEIIVFTASHSCYANVVLDYLDPEKKYISYRLFREHCVMTKEGVNVKDLRVIGNRKIENMLLVDNAAYSFGFQVDNGIPILPFYDHEHDIELKHLIAYLKNLYFFDDAREHNKKTLKINQFSEYQDPSSLLKALYPELLQCHSNSGPGPAAEDDDPARGLTLVA